MIVDIVAVPPAEKLALAAMLAAYVREMQTVIGIASGAGDYPYFDLYWDEPESRWPFWLRTGQANAGFALVRRDDSGRYQMAEFYVVPSLRRHGVGIAAARRLIALHRGRWRITQRAQNAVATAFWRRVLNGVTPYDEMTTHTDAVRVEQHFTSG